MATAELKPIDELFGLSFLIPSYQRGYRWTDTQIRELLEDLYDFSKEKKNDSDYYCLQPVIVKKNGDFWELVDGQQRLTAIWLLSALYYCSNKADIINLARQKYTLVYQEKDCFTKLFGIIDEFVEKNSLVSIKDYFEQYKNANIDSEYLVNSMEYISSFIRDGKPAKGVLTKIFEVISSVKIIWYVLDESEDPIETFTNINANKIELTDAELIKAVLLHSPSDDNKKQSIALQWEEIEKSMNDQAFWAFIANDKKRQYQTRIDYLFYIWCEKNSLLNGSISNHSIFRAVNEMIVAGTRESAAEKIWHEIQEIFETLVDWYKNYSFYHLIGTLLILNKRNDETIINELYTAYSQKSKTDFKDYLIKKIKDTCFGATKSTPFNEFSLEKIRNCINDLTISDKDHVRLVLFLYNISMMINANNSYERFPFELYKAESWDIEHINPQTPQEATKEEKIAWLNSYKSILNTQEDKKLIFDIDHCITNDCSDFQTVAVQINARFSISDNNSITNLVLLDASTNRGYKNACFSDKRKKIIEVERNKCNDEKHILIGTKWVFLKGFENSDQLIVWGLSDMNDYAEDISRSIYTMLGGKTNG